MRCRAAFVSLRYLAHSLILVSNLHSAQSAAPTSFLPLVICESKLPSGSNLSPRHLTCSPNLENVVERKRCFEWLLPSSESVARTASPIPSTERKFFGEETSYGFRAENCERRRRDWFSSKQLRAKAQGLAGQNRNTASEGGGIGFPRNNCERRRRDWQGRIATLRARAQGLVKSENAVEQHKGCYVCDIKS